MSYLEFRQICKSFPGVRALHEVSFGVDQGSVHALLGENGAGKSTLLKILSGMYRADTGEMLINGQPRAFANTSEALAAGVAVIYQELQLVPQVSVAENIFLGHLPRLAGVVRRGDLNREARKYLQILGEDVDPRTRLGDLPIGVRQMVEIAKALAREAKIIAFDEPTSSLSSRETDRLFAVIEQLRKSGKVILYVSHRMDEIYKICDAGTVLRDGKHVETFPKIKEVSRDTLVQRMVGREIKDIWGYRSRPAGAIALEAKGVTGPGVRKPANVTIRRGEIVGFFGLVGAGRTELMKLLVGANRRTSGTVSIDGQSLSGSGPGEAVRKGMIYCSEDRKKEGIVPIRSVSENTNLSVRRLFSPLGVLINYPHEHRNAEHFRQALSVRTSSIHKTIRELSGGNQQKVILGRALAEKPRVILLDEPTRGIDVGAKAEIYNIIYALADQGVAVAMVASELPEVMGVCDRIIVMREGEIVGEVPRAEATQEKLLAYALPVGPAHVKESIAAKGTALS